MGWTGRVYSVWCGWAYTDLRTDSLLHTFMEGFMVGFMVGQGAKPVYQ